MSIDVPMHCACIQKRCTLIIHGIAILVSCRIWSEWMKLTALKQFKVSLLGVSPSSVLSSTLVSKICGHWPKQPIMMIRPWCEILFNAHSFDYTWSLIDNSIITMACVSIFMNP